MGSWSRVYGWALRAWWRSPYLRMWWKSAVWICRLAGTAAHSLAEAEAYTADRVSCYRTRQATGTYPTLPAPSIHSRLDPSYQASVCHTAHTLTLTNNAVTRCMLKRQNNSWINYKRNVKERTETCKRLGTSPYSDGQSTNINKVVFVVMLHDHCPPAAWLVNSDPGHRMVTAHSFTRTMLTLESPVPSCGYTSNVQRHTSITYRF